jgi:drug/metabolite transporter (DMT)-like permease
MILDAMMDEGPQALQILALLTTLGLFAVVVVVLRHRGFRVVACALLFVASLCSTQLAVSFLAHDLGYRFPGFVTCLHLSSVCVGCTIYWTLAGEPWKMLPWSISSSRYLRTIVPAALSQPVSVVFNNKAMVFIGAGLVAIIGTLSPVATALLSRMFGRKLAHLSWLGVMVAFLGGAVISCGEATAVDTSGASHADVVRGLAFAFLAVSGRALKIVVMDVLLAPLAYQNMEKEEPLEVWHVFGLVYPLGTVASIVYAVSTESVSQAWAELTPERMRVVNFSILSALVLNFIGGVVLRDLGASFQQIIGKLNTLCIAAYSVAFLGERLPPVALIGSAFVLAGVALYEAGERSYQHSLEAASTSDGSLKTSTSKAGSTIFSDSQSSDGTDDESDGWPGA